MEYNKECIDLTQIMRLYKNVFKRNRLNYIRGKIVIAVVSTKTTR